MSTRFVSTRVGRKQGRVISYSKKGFWGSLAVTGALIIASVSFVGCSGSDSISSNAKNVNLGAMNYFPIQVGYSASFVVTDANGAELRRESYSADSAVFFGGHRGVRWVQRDLSDSSVISSGVMHWNSDRSILFHSADSSRNVERVLRLPFTTTAVWPRWREPNNGGTTVGDPGTGQTGGDLGNDNGLNDGSNGAGLGNGVEDGTNPLLTSYPTQGLPTFHVASLSVDVTVNGKVYPDCLLVVNANSDNTVNRYWYCPGVGLVKYALNVPFGKSVGATNGSIM